MKVKLEAVPGVGRETRPGVGSHAASEFQEARGSWTQSCGRRRCQDPLSHDRSVAGRTLQPAGASAEL